MTSKFILVWAQDEFRKLQARDNTPYNRGRAKAWCNFFNEAQIYLDDTESLLDWVDVQEENIKPMLMGEHKEYVEGGLKSYAEVNLLLVRVASGDTSFSKLSHKQKYAIKVILEKNPDLEFNGIDKREASAFIDTHGGANV